MTSRLTFHGPLSSARADAIVGRLSANRPHTVLDIGCGWGELLLRVLEAVPEARGTGIDLNETDLARGRRSAEERGLAERVAFLAESARDTDHGPADLVLCVGATQALSDADCPTPEALRSLRRLVSDHGRVLLGEGIWDRRPTPAELAGMWPDAAESDHLTLPALLDLAVESGFRPEWTETATLPEWEEFESGYQADQEVWLAANPDAAEVRERLDRHRAQWMSYRGILGMAYLTLVPVLR
ncbi:methyltransferase domain-containing protein [Streptomyces sp. SID1328]|uniref:SAM-dependent methyltransferase n=1 Tax=Streptomyces sp. SID1328 TaxID=2690250 RepID=UPI00137199EE|nr:class I SAM-dependent methyltransferase [Streptomyces sp. SID1328]MYV40350.1 methyltransferase domain-containing protein [Streptomyces sp. SID1328]